MVFAGLRGAVSLAMALMANLDPNIEPDEKNVIIFHVAMIVALTVVVNGSAAASFYNWLNMYPLNRFRPQLRVRGLRVLACEVEKILEGDHWFHKHAHMGTLTKVLPDFRAASDVDESVEDLRKLNSMEIKHDLGSLLIEKSESIESIFFGPNGYLNLTRWSHVKAVVTAKAMRYLPTEENTEEERRLEGTDSGGDAHVPLAVTTSRDRLSSRATAVTTSPGTNAGTVSPSPHSMHEVVNAADTALKQLHAGTDEEAEMLLYEICFTALGSQYAEMEHHTLISIHCLDRLQEALKKGQDVMVTMRGQTQHERDQVIHFGWYDSGNRKTLLSSRLSRELRSRMSTMHIDSTQREDHLVDAESLRSIKNYVQMKTSAEQMSAYQYKNVEVLMLCTELVWAVREAHLKVLDNVLHGAITDTNDEHVVHAKHALEQEFQKIISDSEVLLHDLHQQHAADGLLQCSCTIITSRVALHILSSKIDVLVQKGFFDERDKESLEYVVTSRMVELQSTMTHSVLDAVWRRVDQLFHPATNRGTQPGGVTFTAQAPRVAPHTRTNVEPTTPSFTRGVPKPDNRPTCTTSQPARAPEPDPRPVSASPKPSKGEALKEHVRVPGPKSRLPPVRPPRLPPASGESSTRAKLGP